MLQSEVTNLKFVFNQFNRNSRRFDRIGFDSWLIFTLIRSFGSSYEKNWHERTLIGGFFLAICLTFLSNLFIGFLMAFFCSRMKNAHNQIPKYINILMKRKREREKKTKSTNSQCQIPIIISFVIRSRERKKN